MNFNFSISNASLSIDVRREQKLDLLFEFPDPEDIDIFEIDSFTETSKEGDDSQLCISSAPSPINFAKLPLVDLAIRQELGIAATTQKSAELMAIEKVDKHFLKDVIVARKFAKSKFVSVFSIP